MNDFNGVESAVYFNHTADEPELFTVFSEDGIVDDPSPWPATVGGGAFILGVAPHGEEHLKAQASQSLKPGAFGQSA